jgi:hypothetical protein
MFTLVEWVRAVMAHPVASMAVVLPATVTVIRAPAVALPTCAYLKI